jgi:hypothetical protein
MHPPDLIEILDDQTANTIPRVTVRGLALVARGTEFPSCQSQEFDVIPEAPRPPNTVVAYEELRAGYPEVYFPGGENQDTGSWVTNLGDHIHVKAKVCGQQFGSPGRFKALYRVWWTPTEQAVPRPLTYYRILTFAGKVLDVEANSCTDGAHVIQYTWNGGDNQRWRFEKQSDGTYIIVNKASQEVLDVTGGPAALGAGTKVQQWSNLNGSNQRWRIEDAGQGLVRLVAAHSGQVLDVEAASPLDLTRIQQWPWMAGANQKFSLEVLPGDMYVPFSRRTCN